MNQRAKSLAALLLFSFTCVSYAGAQERGNGGLNENFTTEITENGKKTFSYHVSKGSSGRKGNNGEGRRGGRSGLRDGAERNKSELIEKLLAKKLETTGYCQQGYIKSESGSEEAGFYIKGQCKESATQNDRGKFPNKY